MSIVASPPLAPTNPDELELLIREARARQRRRRIVAAAVVALVAGVAVGVAAIVPSGSPKAVPGRGNARIVSPSAFCRVAQLRLSLARGGVATGSVIDRFEFTNRSSAACVVSGWPTFTLVLRDGRRVETAPHELIADAYSVRHPPRLPRRILRPGASAPWFVQTADGAGINRFCPTAREMLVVPPHMEGSIAVPLSLPYCGSRWINVLPIGRAP